MAEGNEIPWPIQQAPQQAAQSQGIAGIGSFDSLLKPPHTASEMAQLALGASVPSGTAHSMATPLNLQPNQKQFQGAPLDHSPTPVGKGNSKGQGIANAITGVANAIGGYETGVQNKKNLQLATDTHTLLLSQSNIDQAKQILQADPDNANAKDMLEHNTNVRDGILSDDKTRKAIGKGFKIDFTDPKANDTPEHQAVKQGQQMAEKAQKLSYGEQFSKGVPTQATQNAVAVAKYQQAQAENKAALDTAKILGPMVRAQITAGATVDAAKIRVDGENARAVFLSQSRAEQAMRNFQDKQKLEGIHYSHESSLIAQRLNGEFQKSKQLMDLKDQDPVAIMTKSTASLTSLQRVLGETQGRISAIDNQIADEGAKNSSQDPNKIKELRTEKEEMLKVYNAANKNYDDTKMFFDGLKLGGSKNGQQPGPDPAAIEQHDTNELNSIDSYLGGDDEEPE